MTQLAITLKTNGRRLGVWLAVLLVRAYQILLSPLLVGGGCRHVPSCSDYAIEALEWHGFRRGSQLALSRLWRCRPGGSMGYDPVPEPKDELIRSNHG